MNTFNDEKKKVTIYSVAHEAGVSLATVSRVINDSSLVKEETKRAVEDAKKEILNGRDVFSGVIYDNTGKLRCGENESMSDDSLMEHMDWYVEGARFYEKESDKK